MIEIISHGIYSETQRCYYCDCVFRYDTREDIRRDENYNGYIICPECRTKLIVDYVSSPDIAE